MGGGGKGGGGGDIEQTTKSEPWGPLQPYLAGGYIRRPTGVGGNLGNGTMPAPGSLVGQGYPIPGGQNLGGSGLTYDNGSDNSLIYGYGPGGGGLSGGGGFFGGGSGGMSGDIPVRGLWDLSYEQAMRPMEDAYRFGPMTKQARGDLLRHTQNPSELERSARRQFKDTIRGDYLYGGEGFNAAYNAAANKIIPQVSSMFSEGGRLNSGLAQGAMTSNLGDAFAGLYNQERARQLAAANQYPALQQAQMQRLQVPLALGQDADQLRRQRMFSPQQQLGWLGQQLGAVAPGGGSASSSSPSQSSMLGNVLGAASLGSGIFNNAGLGSALSSFGASAPLWAPAAAGTAFSAGSIPPALALAFGF